MFTHDVRDVGSRQTDKELQRRRQQHAKKQYPQRRERLGRNNPVIDLHRKQNPPQRHHVADDRGQRDFRELAPGMAEMTPEPVRLPRASKVIDTRVAPAYRNTQHDHIGSDALKQRLQRLFPHQIAAVAEPVGHQSLGVERLQQHDFATFHLHDGGQVLRAPAHFRHRDPVHL